LVTDISGQHIGSIFQHKAVQDSHKSKTLKYAVAEARNFALSCWFKCLTIAT